MGVWGKIKRILHIFRQYIQIVRNKLLYTTPAGRRLFWKKHAVYLYQRYKDNDADFDTLWPVLETVRPQTLLDVGCGNGRMFSTYQEHGVPKIVGQDISSSAIAYARERNISGTKLFLGDLDSLAFPAGYFDLAVCSRVLQHVPPGEVSQMVAAICRLAKRVYVNEMTLDECMANGLDPQKFGGYLFVHDTIPLFAAYGYGLHEERVVAEGVCKGQQRRLFVKIDSEQ